MVTKCAGSITTLREILLLVEITETKKKKKSGASK